MTEACAGGDRTARWQRGPRQGRFWVTGLLWPVMPVVQQAIAKHMLAKLEPATAASAQVRPRLR